MTPEQRAAFENAAGYSVYEFHLFIVALGVTMTLLLSGFLTYRLYQAYSQKGGSVMWHLVGILFFTVVTCYLLMH